MLQSIVVSNISIPGMEMVVVGDLFFHFGSTVAIMDVSPSNILLVEEDVMFSTQNLTVDFDMFNAFSSGSTQLNPAWNLDRIDQVSLPLDKKYTWVGDGNTANVYVLDTGVQVSHPEFEGRASWGANFADSEPPTGCMDSHGTHVAGTIGGKTYGVAKSSSIVSVKVLDCEGSGSTSNIIKGISYVIKDKRKNKIINMSIGGGFSAALNMASDQAYKSGILVVAAAGNENQDACNVSPASENSIITVGASDIRDTFASFSNWGKCVDIIAPGVDILSSIPNGKAVFSGTSMASPMVAGAAAKFMSYGKTNVQTKAILLASASVNRVKGNLRGSPNKLLFSSPYLFL